MAPTFFATPEDFRTWLAKNHDTQTELIVGYYKVATGKPSMTWSQSVDEAICYGWIDGIRRSVDKDSYTIRFTPRKPNSIWSAININKVEALTQEGRMRPAGVAAFKLREEHRSRVYSFENEPVSLSGKFEKLLKANKRAWTFFRSLPPSYQKTAARWVMSAKQETTRIARLHQLIADSEAGEKIKPLRYGSVKY